MKLDWKHLFNWDISVVSMNTLRQDNIIQGYKVVVSYKYHGDKVFYYDRKYDRPEYPLMGAKQIAESTYNHYKAKMKPSKSR